MAGDLLFPLTASASIDLVTPSALRAALRLLGIEWAHTWPAELTTDPGLYMWVIGRGVDVAELLHRPVAYVGIGTGLDGVRGRVSREVGWTSAAAEHIHGRAMYLLGGAAIGGPVRRIGKCDLSWLDQRIHAEGAAKLRAWLAPQHRLSLEARAEQLCVRTAAHIGDCPPPLNSQYAGVWSSDAESDWGGWAVAQELRNDSSAIA